MSFPTKKLIYQEFDKEGNIVEQTERSDFRDDWTDLKTYWTNFYYWFSSTIPHSLGFIDKYMFCPGDEHCTMVLHTSSSSPDDSAELALERCLNKLPKKKVLQILKKNGF